MRWVPSLTSDRQLGPAVRGGNDRTPLVTDPADSQFFAWR
jgi:hypothetical protein